MRVLFAFVLYLIIAFNSPLSLGHLTALLSSSELKCSTTQLEGNLWFSCAGATRIPRPTDTKSDHTEVDILALDSNDHIHTLKTNEFKTAGFINVQAIGLKNCNIRTIESGAFSDLEALVVVALENNKIESLNMAMFQNNDKLQVVLLSGNPIHQFIGNQFPTLPLLKAIRLNDARITEIPNNVFEQLPNLRELDLRNNTIRRLSWITFQNSTMLSHVHLDNNEWECDCHMGFLQTFLKKKSIDISSTVICKGPEKFANVPLSKVNQEELICPPQITGLNPVGPYQQADGRPDDLDLTVYAETGQNIRLECVVDGFPQPEIIWMKDNRPIDEHNELRKPDSHYKVTDSIKNIGVRPEFRHTFSKQLTIFSTSQTDIGTYECATYHKTNYANRVVQTVYLNLTNINDDKGEEVVITTKIEDGNIVTGNVMWVLVLVGVIALVIIIITLFIGGILIWKRKERQRQLKHPKDTMIKLKPTEIHLTEEEIRELCHKF